jgi:hypothetical protein
VRAKSALRPASTGARSKSNAANPWRSSSSAASGSSSRSRAPGDERAIRVGAKPNRFVDQGETGRAVIRQQRPVAQEQLVVKVVGVVAIEDVISGEQRVERPGVGGERLAHRIARRR